MSELDFFENTSIKLIENKVYASRNQLQELYDIPKKTLADTILTLKEDLLIVGAEFRPKSGRSYEVYNLKEVLAIGMRLRSEKAIKFQIWAINQLESIIQKQIEEIRNAQLMESIAWNHLDAKDNYR